MAGNVSTVSGVRRFLFPLQFLLLSGLDSELTFFFFLA